MFDLDAYLRRIALRGRPALAWGELGLLERTPDTSRTTPVQRAEVPALLAERFELDGFTVGLDGRLALTQQPTETRFPRCSGGAPGRSAALRWGASCVFPPPPLPPLR